MTENGALSEAQIDAAAHLLAAARRTGRRIDGLPQAVRPTSIEEGHAIQDRVVELLGEQAGALKVNAPPTGGVFRGVIDATRVIQSPARLAAADAGLMGIEAEVAFVFPDGVPAREEPYDYDELAALARGLPAFDVVDTRLDDFMSRTQFERIADCLNAGTLVCGPASERWRDIDFSAIEVTLKVDSRVVVRERGGHARADPFVPAVAYANSVLDTGIGAGMILTTGSFTGLHYARSRERVRAEFPGLGVVEVSFTA